MTAAEFKKKWSRYTGKESAAYQEHFNDFCRQPRTQSSQFVSRIILHRRERKRNIPTTNTAQITMAEKHQTNGHPRAKLVHSTKRGKIFLGDSLSLFRDIIEPKSLDLI